MLCVLHTGNAGHKGMRTHRADHSIGVHALQKFPGGLGPQHDIDACTLTAGNQRITIAEQRLLVGVHLGKPQKTAQLILFLDQGDLMSALLGRDRRIHTSHTAAHYNDIPACQRTGRISPAEFPLSPRVDGTMPELRDRALIGIRRQRIKAGAAPGKAQFRLHGPSGSC